MPVLFLYNYPDTATEPVNFEDYIINKSDVAYAPSDEQIKKLNDLRSRIASLLLSQPNTKAILDVN